MTRTTEIKADRRWITLILLTVAQFIVVLDASIVNVALPSIGRGLHFSDKDLPWVLNAYVIAFGGFLLLGGRAADLLGRRRVFMAGLAGVAVASFAAGFAATRGELIAARAAQGLAAAFISPSALSIVTTLFTDGTERNRALGAWGAVSGAAGAVGVLLGGVLTSGLSWQWVLWVNVPVSLIALALTPGLVPESRSDSTTRHFDVAGAVTITAGLSILAYALLDAGTAGWGSAKTIGLIAASIVLIGAVLAIELRSKAPLVPLRIFRARTVAGANVVGLLLGASLFGMFFFITLYMQQVLHYSPIHAGLSYLPLRRRSSSRPLSAGSSSPGSASSRSSPPRWRSSPAGYSGSATSGCTAASWPTSSAPRCWRAIGLGFGFVTSTIAAVAGVGSASRASRAV